MRDFLNEIFANFKRNKLRTSLTGFAVSWGIFMLITLLGAGNGLSNSMNKSNERFSSNTMMFGANSTSKAYGGYKAGRRLRLDQTDVEFLSSGIFENIDEVSGNNSTNGLLSYGKKHYSVSLEGCYPEMAKMEKLVILSGRFINQKDQEERRKVIVIPKSIAEKISDDPMSLLNKYIKLENFMFKVVGILKSDEANMGESVLMPINTLTTVFNTGKWLWNITFSFHGLNNEKETEAFEKNFKRTMNIRKGADPDDEATFWTWNRFSSYLSMQKGNAIISLALWILGILTLLGGVVGVSNIMLITVKERTHEFGIRKAIGATPWAINKLIIGESVAITTVFGYIGMILGLFACEILDKTVAQHSTTLFGEEFYILQNPTVDVSTAIGATILLIVAGTLAGLIPAHKAAKVKPIEALRSE